tara:strand:+ start:578 stop:688 length:111 start_codon:yes stop_codon:yes gene_type:complete
VDDEKVRRKKEKKLNITLEVDFCPRYLIMIEIEEDN